MPRKGENIFKRKDGRWEGRFIKGYKDGRAIYGYVFGKSYSEAKKKKSDAMAGHATSTTPAVSTKPAPRSTSHSYAAPQPPQPKCVFNQAACNLPEQTFSQPFPEQPFLKDLAHRWLNGLKATRKKSTVAKYEGQLRNHIIPEFGDKRIDEISNNDIIAFSQKLLTKPRKRKKPLSPRTTSDILSRLRSIRKFAVLHGYEVKYISDCAEIPQKPEKISVLTSEEEKQLVAYLKNNLNPTSLGILLSLFTGIRLGELCALKWSDFSLKEREFRISKTMQRLPNPDKAASQKTQVEIGEPKSPCSIRTIPIPEKLMDFLNAAHSSSDTYILTGYEHYFIEPRTMENRFKAVLKKCGIADTKFHTLRHTFAIRCVEIGFDVKTLSEILGHAGVNITLNRYVHPSMKTKHENMNRLNELFG